MLKGRKRDCLVCSDENCIGIIWRFIFASQEIIQEKMKQES